MTSIGATTRPLQAARVTALLSFANWAKQSPCRSSKVTRWTSTLSNGIPPESCSRPAQTTRQRKSGVSPAISASSISRTTPRRFIQSSGTPRQMSSSLRTAPFEKRLFIFTIFPVRPLTPLSSSGTSTWANASTRSVDTRRRFTRSRTHPTDDTLPLGRLTTCSMCGQSRMVPSSSPSVEMEASLTSPGITGETRLLRACPTTLSA